MPDASLKVENARYIITMDGERRIIRDGAVIMEGSRIAQVGKSADLADVAANRVIDADGMVVAPGLVNGHMHISYAHATRGIFPDSLGSNYLPNVFRLQGEMTAEEEYLTSLLGITELLKYGTTTFIDPGSTKFLDAGLRAYEQSGCRIIVGAHVTDIPNPVNLPVYETDEAIAIVERVIRDYDGALDGRVRAWAMPFGPNFATSPAASGVQAPGRRQRRLADPALQQQPRLRGVLPARPRDAAHPIPGEYWRPRRKRCDVPLPGPGPVGGGDPGPHRDESGGSAYGGGEVGLRDDLGRAAA